jgi:predicted Fe-Mo cluster-binding NifX family protein
MTCYFRHLQDIFKKAGIEVTSANKREIDQIIHRIVSIRYKDCPATWKEVKKRIANDEKGFVGELKTEWKKHA